MSAAPGDPPMPEATSLQLMSEDLRIERVRVDGDRVVVGTMTRDVEHAVDEALVHERVEIERVAVGRPVSAIPEVREEGDVTVFPVVEEVLVVERRLVLKEEIRVRRVRVEGRHRETVILREQEAVVTRTPAEPSLLSTESTTKETNMTEETIVAIYDTAAHAEAAVSDLKANHVPDSAISQHASAGSTTAGTASPTHEKGFWASLFGEEHGSHGEVYGRSVEAGSTVVSVKVASEHYDHVAAILEKHDPADVEERSSQYGLGNASAATPTGYVGHAGMTEPAQDATEANAIGASGLTPDPVMATGHGATDRSGMPSQVATGHSATGLGARAEGIEGDTLQLAAESLEVGKRAVQGGTTRIRRFTVSKPVEENVTLHNEKVVLDRRPVTDGRVLTNADFTDKTISMTETNEEAVVSKTARVVEEIGLHKEASDRVETVRDTLRHDEVEVEQVPVDRNERVDMARTTPVDRKI